MRRILLLLLFLSGSGWLCAQAVEPVKYVFLFIGDGMADTQRELAERYLRQTGRPEGMLINRFPHQAPTTTHAASHPVTDSAAAATAMACGIKTNNGMLGVDPDGKPKESIARTARQQGRKVGIVTTVTLNHATPAAFYARADSRKSYYDIALQLVPSGFDYFAGAGVASADDRKSPNYQGDIYALAAAAGYAVVRDVAAFGQLRPGGKALVGIPPVAYSEVFLPPAEESPSLADFVRKGIELLDNPRGFFMMAEGGQIDTRCHANDAGGSLWETIDFDRAVAVAYAFAEKHLEETLIVVTGDHETGGLTLDGVDTGYVQDVTRLGRQKLSGVAFVALCKKMADKTGDRLSFAAMQPILEENFGLRFDGQPDPVWSVTEAEAKLLTDGFNRMVTPAADGKTAPLAFPVAVGKVFNAKVGIGWTTTGHTARNVVTSAYGHGAERFSGELDNTDIARLLRPLLQ